MLVKIGLVHCQNIPMFIICIIKVYIIYITNILYIIGIYNIYSKGIYIPTLTINPMDQNEHLRLVKFQETFK